MASFFPFLIDFVSVLCSVGSVILLEFLFVVFVVLSLTALIDLVSGSD